MAERIEAAARVYAQALHEAATEAGSVREADEHLSAFVAALAANRQLLRALLNPRLPRDAKQRIVSATLKDVDPLVANAVRVIVDNGRFGLIGDIQVAFHELAAVDERVLDVEVTSAVPLGQQATADLERRISSATGLTARLSASVDPSIIGGLVLRARGVLLDASVKRELDDIRRALITTPLPIGSEA